MNIMLLSIWEFWENRCIEGPTFLTSINDVKFIHILSPLSASPPYPHLCISIYVTWLRSHFIITLTTIMVITSMGRLALLCVQKHHITSAIFATETIILGVLWVRPGILNDECSKTMLQATVHCVKLYIVYRGVFQDQKQ